MGKDPAVLFYTKDWLEGTVDMFPEEKGVYIDLLCYQHQKGFLPENKRRLAKITGLSEAEFQKIWQEIQSKFITVASLDPSLGDALTEWKSKTNSDGKSDGLVNIRMLKETVSRRKINTKKSIQAYVTNWFRYEQAGKTVDKKIKATILESVEYEKLVKINAGKKEVYGHMNTLTQRLVEQSQKANGDANANASINENTIENGNEKKLSSRSLKSSNKDFQSKVCHFFSLTGATREPILHRTLEDLERKNQLQEFIDQTEAYMAYKAASKEKIHGWQKYTLDWQHTDWCHKLSQWQAASKPKPKFHINR